uniref:Uncharacterized protein n=1 Tax=Oryza brachyantha TaxID=4533 RepID=J3ME33_ORYBR
MGGGRGMSGGAVSSPHGGADEDEAQEASLHGGRLMGLMADRKERGDDRGMGSGARSCPDHERELRLDRRPWRGRDVVSAFGAHGSLHWPSSRAPMDWSPPAALEAGLPQSQQSRSAAKHRSRDPALARKAQP